MKKKKEKKIRKCAICGKLFFFNFPRREGKIKDQVCSQKCYQELRRRHFLKWNKERRKKRRSKNLCGDCGKKVQIIKIYPYRCQKCSDRLKKLRKKK